MDTQYSKSRIDFGADGITVGRGGIVPREKERIMNVQYILEAIERVASEGRGAPKLTRAYCLFETVVVPHFGMDHCELVEKIVHRRVARSALLGNVDPNAERKLRETVVCGSLVEFFKGDVPVSHVFHGGTIFVVGAAEVNFLEHRVSAGDILIAVEFDSVSVMRATDIFIGGQWSYEFIKRIAA